VSGGGHENPHNAYRRCHNALGDSRPCHATHRRCEPRSASHVLWRRRGHGLTWQTLDRQSQAAPPRQPSPSTAKKPHVTQCCRPIRWQTETCSTTSLMAAQRDHDCRAARLVPRKPAPNRDSHPYPRQCPSHLWGTCPACLPPATEAVAIRYSGCCGVPTTGTSPAMSPGERRLRSWA
jgi:hypothetical protein